MTALGEILVIYNIEPLVKIFCTASDCEFNLLLEHDGEASCNLKRITIGNGGQCKSYKKDPEKQDENDRN